MNEDTTTRLRKGFKYFKTIGKEKWGTELAYRHFCTLMALMEEYLEGSEAYYSAIMGGKNEL